jgi:hypothetical protein
MIGWIIVFISGSVLFLGAYCTIRLLTTLHRDEFTDPDL